MVGLGTRVTMNMEVTIKGNDQVFKKIIAVTRDDTISFEFKNISEIRENANYNGYRVHLVGNFTQCQSL
ncbi:hypothetical protein HCB45_14180 [Listeria sp. FSL L7-0091]|uniref:hypothetical protein n=1 Tax=Listeria farberi TaxID=2713500 RepID=UPI0016291FB4|nr:hypothetical protein [Listeria farberi]MBC2262707.1 hypothetical protein [Listeria farberi]